MAGLYAKNGSVNVTTVLGTTNVSAYAKDGSYNIIYAPSPVTRNVGSTHPCGAMYVTTANEATPKGLHAPDGSVLVSETGRKTGAMFITKL